MTLTDLAEKLGVTQQNVSAKLKKNDMRISEIEKILGVLGYKLNVEFKKIEPQQALFLFPILKFVTK